MQEANAMQREHEVRLIAYHIWEEEGRPAGHDLDHWLRAESLWRDEQDQMLEHIGRDVESY